MDFRKRKWSHAGCVFYCHTDRTDYTDFLGHTEPLARRRQSTENTEMKLRGRSFGWGRYAQNYQKIGSKIIQNHQ